MANIDNLFPTDLDLEADHETFEDVDEVIGYKTAPYFDSKTGDFLTDGSGQILTADKITAFAQWCENVIAVDRYKHDGYTEYTGIDYDAIFSAQTREEAENIIESEISEALAVDPYGRTIYVQSVDCEWISSDAVSVVVVVEALENEIVTIETTINK